jgi:hypothetical protein
MVDHIPVYPKSLKRVPALRLKRLAPRMPIGNIE